MAKLAHRQINIDDQLSLVRDLARKLRGTVSVASLSEMVGTLLGQSDRTPLVELFNWAHTKAAKDSAIEPLRDDLFVLLHICSQIARHCAQSRMHPGSAIEPLDRDLIAKRLELVIASLNLETARIEQENDETAS